MKTAGSLKLIPTDLEFAAAHYKALMDDIKAIEQALEPFRELLEQAASMAGGTLETGTYRIQVNQAERESISVKAAKAQLGRLIKPFLKSVTYTQLRVIQKKAA